MHLIFALAVLAGPPDDPLAGLPRTLSLDPVQALDSAQDQEPDIAAARKRMRHRTVNTTYPRVAMYARVSTFLGEDAIEGMAAYEELFQAGAGVGLEYTYYYWTGQPQHGGLYLQVTADMFKGRTIRDSLGNSIEADDLLIGAVMFGGKVATSPFEFGKLGKKIPIHFTFRVAAGAAYINELEADVAIINGTGAPITGTSDVLDQSVMFVGEAGVRMHFGIFHLGAGIRYMTEPQEDDAFPRLDPDEAVSAVFDAGLTFRF